MASHLLRSVLGPALRLWLQSQVESVKRLELAIESSDRQLLSGKIPQVAIEAEAALYQGLHLSRIAIEGRDIAVNLAQVMRGKPLQLLTPIAVVAAVVLEEADLNASLASDLLAPVWLDWQRQLWDRLQGSGQDLGIGDWGSGIWDQPTIALGIGGLTLGCGIRSAIGAGSKSLVLTAPVSVTEGRCLTLVRPRWTIGGVDGQPDSQGDFEDLVLDLGETVAIEFLELQAQRLVCRGQLWVQP
jgi:hypothetical protein